MRERIPPARKMLDFRIEALAVRPRQPNRRMDMDVLAVGVHHEHIFVAGKFLRERRPRRVHESLFVSAGLGAENDMREIPRTPRPHLRLPAFRNLQAGVEIIGSGSPCRARPTLPDRMSLLPKSSPAGV